MIIRYIKDVAGISAGVCKNLRDVIAKELIKQGVAEEVKLESKKEIKEEIETKEEKVVSKRRTKSKK